MAFPFGAATPPRMAISCRLGGRLTRTRLAYSVLRHTPDQRRRSKGPKSQAEIES